MSFDDGFYTHRFVSVVSGGCVLMLIRFYL